MKIVSVIALVVSVSLGSAEAAPRGRGQGKQGAKATTNTRGARPAATTNKLATKLRQRPATVVKTWTSGNGDGHSVVFLHGLGGVPEGPMINTILRGLNEQGVSATFKAPVLRDIEMNAQGDIVNESVQTMSEQLHHAREVIRGQANRVVLFGHSFGAKATLQLAKEFPNKISAIIAIAPSVKMLHAYWKSVSGERGLATPERMTATFEQYQAQLEQRLAQADRSEQRSQIREAIDYHSVMRDLVQYNEAALELDVKVPTLVFHGAQDQAVSIHYVKRFADANKNVELVTYKDHDHHLVADSPEATLSGRLDVASRVARFLETTNLN